MRYLAAFLAASALCAAPVRTTRALAEGWSVRQLDTDRPDVAALARESGWMEARMPAQVHEILLANGRIPDPHVGKNAAASAWVGEKDWAYRCRFKSPAAAGGPVWLRFGGLDTLATAYLNGALIGRFDNMFREFAVDVRKQLAAAGQENVLLIVFSSPLRFVNAVEQSPEEAKVLPKYKYLRKCHSDFGSYLGATPHSVKIGVFRDVVLDTAGRSWIDDVWVRTSTTVDHTRATVRVRAALGGAAATAAWVLTDPAGREVAHGEGSEPRIEVREPKLWWPRTHGTPNLYRLRVDLKDGMEVLDSRTVNVGIREIRLVTSDPASGEKRFRFEINGRPVFLRGACWAPIEGITQCWRPDRAKTLLDLAEHGRMNIFRVWGEGYEPPAEFYDECDRRGILVWQDFMFGYGMHPSHVAAFTANAKAEIEEMIRRLRNHPSLLLWVGGNENHMGTDFAGVKTEIGRDLFGGIMPEAVARLDPDRAFHPSSPYGGPVPNWPLEGDWHDYTTLTFSPEASVPAFASEVGRASAPSLASMRRFLSEEELWPKGYDPTVRVPGRPMWPPMWQYRSVGGSWDKVGPVEQYMEPRSAEELIRVLGTAHGEYLRQRVERERRGVPDGAPDGNRRCWGNMVWRLNDAWPILYWSVIDYYLSPKIPYYFLRRAYAPVLVSFERTPDRIAVWVTNDSPEQSSGRLVVKKRRFDGNLRGELASEVKVGPGESRRVLDLTPFGPISLREEFLQASYNGQETTYLLASERNLKLPQAHLTVVREGNRIVISSDVFARQVRVEAGDAVFDDNYFDLPPGESKRLSVVSGTIDGELRVSALR